MSKLIVNEIQAPTGAAGLKMPAGSIVQVQSVQCGSSGNSLTVTAGSTWTDIPEATITFTPQFATSKLLIETYQHCYLGNNSTSTQWSSVNLRIMAGSTNLSNIDANATDYYAATYGGDNSREMAYALESAYYSPGSTASVVYKVQMNFRHGSGGAASTILNRYARGMVKIMEITQ